MSQERSNKKEKISMIVPVYNTEKYLRRCLESIVNQEYENIEVIIVDDGSKDGSLEIIKQYAAKYDFIKYIQQKNKGVGAARNRGFSVSQGQFISFIDSDDYISTDYCSYLQGIINDADIVVAGRNKYVNEIFKNANGPVMTMEISGIEAIRYMFLSQYNCRSAWGKLYKREIVEDVVFVEGKIFEEVRYSFDTFCKSRKVILAEREVYNYMMRPGSIITSDQAKHVTDLADSFVYIYMKQLIGEEC